MGAFNPNVHTRWLLTPLQTIDKAQVRYPVAIHGITLLMRDPRNY